jgi:hypothetical protein
MDTDKNEVLTRFEAQKKMGLLSGIDYTAFVVIVVSSLVFTCWCFFGNPTLMQVFACFLAFITLLMSWTVILIFRVLVFILDLRAEVNLMPEAASRIVLGFYEGRTKNDNVH